MIKINDRRLWGNEAADDEDPEILSSYFVSNQNYDLYFDLNTKLSIARARKGMGKSALINEFANRVEKNDRCIVINIKGAELVAQKPIKYMTADEHIYDWQQRICMCINQHIGNHIGFAINDDEMIQVETAELLGFKRRNLIGSLVDRLKGKLGPVQLQKLEAKDYKQLLKRSTEDGNWLIWLLIDDIDATFINTPEECLRLSTFFSACRDLSTSFVGIKIRSCIRTDVWTSIRRRDEALDKCEQYIFDINWSQRQMGLMLSERVHSYTERYLGKQRQSPERKRMIEAGMIKPADETAVHTENLEKIFASKFPWGRSVAEPHRVIHVFAGGRPRWATQLCRMAAEEAVKVQDSIIKFGHIKQVLEEYGRFRLDDISREHNHQCPQIDSIVNTFSKQKCEYTSDMLLDFIGKAILHKQEVFIDGLMVESPLLLARYLFRTGFIVAKEQSFSKLRYYRFEEKSELLKNFTNIDDNLNWYIHPSFHAALSVSN